MAHFLRTGHFLASPTPARSLPARVGFVGSFVVLQMERHRVRGAGMFRRRRSTKNPIPQKKGKGKKREDWSPGKLRSAVYLLIVTREALEPQVCLCINKINQRSLKFKVYAGNRTEMSSLETGSYFTQKRQHLRWFCPACLEQGFAMMINGSSPFQLRSAN